MIADSPNIVLALCATFCVVVNNVVIAFSATFCLLSPIASAVWDILSQHDSASWEQNAIDTFCGIETSIVSLSLSACATAV